MIFFTATRYLKYILLSRHRKGHGIHSPFVFNLVTRVFRNKINPAIVCNIEKIRRRMIANKRSIIFKDMGSGKKRKKSDLRKVSDIGKYSSVPQKYGILLSNMAAEFGEPLIIELGTSLGISTMYMASACKGVIVNTVEGCLEISEMAKANFKEAGLTNINVFTGSFDDVLSVLVSNSYKPGLVFIDGNHRKDPVIKYFSIFAEVADSKTVIIIDDIYYSREMEEAWKQIKLHEKVTITVDIFRMGMVFFREGINHNDYIIRY